jgi:hypothetical protein
MAKGLFVASMLISLSAVSCTGITFPPSGQIIAHVHWQNLNEAGKMIVLVEVHDTLYTDTAGLATFVVRAGQYTVRAFGINRGGPLFAFVDYSVKLLPEATITVDIVDCLPCN